MDKPADQSRNLNMWSLSKDRISLAKYRPARIDKAELAEIGGRGGAKQFMLRNPGNDKYISLGETARANIYHFFHRSRYCLLYSLFPLVTRAGTLSCDRLKNKMKGEKDNGYKRRNEKDRYQGDRR
jgi:hypothetical protein